MPGESPDWLAPDDLLEPVSALIAADVATITEWSCTPLVGGTGEALGVWRVTGTAISSENRIPWSIILKGWAPQRDAAELTAWNHPVREALAYGSGVLDDLPGGIHAPQFLGSRVRSDRSTWMWLREMPDDAPDTWTLEHFALVAWHLGRFNGTYLTGRPLPIFPWLSRQWTRQWTEATGDAIGQIERHAAHPVYSRAFSPSTVRAMQALWADRHPWLTMLEEMPQTFAHLDVFTRNVILGPGHDGGPTPCLIDWGFAGIAAVGEEIAPLMAASIIHGGSLSIPYDELDRAVFEGYVKGLRDAGWTGDERSVRAGYIASVALRYGVGTQRVLLPLLVDEHHYPYLEEVFNLPILEVGDCFAARAEWIMNLSDELRRLLPSLPPTTPDAV